MTKTFTPKRDEALADRHWHVVDADGATLGRLSSVVAQLLLGKHKPTWAPHMDSGDFVVVINAEKTVLTGRKEELKTYYRHSGRPGGMKTETAAERRAKYPTRLVETAVKGMLPKTKLGRQVLKKLKVYAGDSHPHAAQKPEPFELEGGQKAAGA